MSRANPSSVRAASATVATALGTLLIAGLSPLSAATGAPASPAEPPINLNPTQLSRGSDAKIPYLRGKTIVDGSNRVTVRVKQAGLLGKSGDDYVLWATSGSAAPNIVKVTPSGGLTTLVTGGDGFNAVLSSDGSRVAVPKPKVKAKGTVIKLYDVADGSRVAKTKVPGFGNLLDIDDGRVIVGTTSPARTISWDYERDTKNQLAKRTAYAANIAVNRLAVFDKDPFAGGCSVVSTLSDPKAVFARSCSERVYAFAPNGRRMAVIDLLTDGIGPNQVIVRRVGGREEAAYVAPFFFGDIVWEGNRKLLLETNARRRSALVRCAGTTCQRASKIGPAPSVRPLPSFRHAQFESPSTSSLDRP